MKGRITITIHTSLQKKALDQLHLNHMAIKKMRLMAHEFIYWIKINADMENTIKILPAYLDFQATQPKDKTLPHEILGRPWESVPADIFSINNKHHLCTVDYHSRIPEIEQFKG